MSIILYENGNLSSLEHLPYFTIQAGKQCFPSEGKKGTVQTAVYRWMKNDKLIQFKMVFIHPENFLIYTITILIFQ